MENDLIKNACEWFEREYKDSPQNLGMTHIKIWNKVGPFYTHQCIVFAKNQKEADHFTFIQDVIFTTLSYFWVVGLWAFIGFIAAVVYQNIVPLVALMAFCVAMVIFYLAMAIIGRKWEKEYAGRIVTCYVEYLECSCECSDDDDQEED